MTDLTKKESFKWNDEAQVMMEKMKEVMSTCPVLALPDFGIPFTLECDALGEGIGVVLMQNKHPWTMKAGNSRVLNYFTAFTTKKCWLSCMH